MSIMKKKNLLFLPVAGFIATACVTSCTNKEDVFDSSYMQGVLSEKYADNFEAKYGKISPTQTWDFTSGESRLATRAVTAIKTEIMENGIDYGDVTKLELDRKWPGVMGSVINGGVQKNADLFNAIETALPERHAWEGKPVVLVAPSSGFYIYPLFCGGRLYLDLKVKVGDNEPVTVFSKDWKNFQTINGMWKDEKADGEKINMRGIYIEAPVGTPVEVYLDNIRDNRDYPSPAGTTNGRAVYVDIPEDINFTIDGIDLKENATVKYIGIEDIGTDCRWETTDNDFNDVVLAVIGNPDVPQESIITEDKYDVKTCRAKRYMIEDLGAVDDFDFNDVVVDVEEYTVTTHTVTYENGILKNDVVTDVTTEPAKAILRCMGGTLDFELNIGGTKWAKKGSSYEVGTMYNTQGEIDYGRAMAEFEVPGWKYEENNIAITVNNENGQVYNITFPKAGTAPMIIAVDPTQTWMRERVSIPKTWFTE